MPIPNPDTAAVPVERVQLYLLNRDHPVGGSKAVWFLGVGYQLEEPQILVDDLLSIARSCKDFVEQLFAYGVKYIAVGDVVAPNGTVCSMKTVWKVESGTTSPVFVTAYPA